MNNKTNEKFKHALLEITWDHAISSQQTDFTYEVFLN